MIGLPFEDAFATELGKVYQDLPRNPLIFYFFLGKTERCNQIKDWFAEIEFTYDVMPATAWGEHVEDCFVNFDTRPDLAILFKLKFCNA